MSDAVSAVSVVDFRTAYPEFDPSVYPDSQVNTFLLLGTVSLDPIRWGAMYDMGIMLFAAHNLAVARRAAGAGSTGLLGTTGVTSSKTLGKASVTYDNTLSAIKGAGPFNLTTYGQMFFYWANLFGIGAVQLTGNDGPAAPGFNNFTQTRGWSGPHS